jgi:hypothetical protein
MNRRGTFQAVAITVSLLLVGAESAQAARLVRCDLRSEMRKLWEDHVTWTRLYIVEATADMPGKDETAKRLLKNQVDIGNAIKPFYGEAAGTKLTALLKDHILIAVDIIDAAKKGDAAKKDDAVRRWNSNADAIADFLSGANPKNWPQADMRMMMRDHLSLTTEELVAHLQKNWAADVAAYDKVHAEILHMSDELTSGIAKQFPDRVQ